MIFKVPKVPFLGFLSNARKLEIENICPDYFPESSIIVILLLKMLIVKNLTDFRKTVEAGVDPRLETTMTRSGQFERRGFDVEPVKLKYAFILNLTPAIFTHKLI